MTVKEVIEKTASLRRNNQFTIEDKMRWLNECEAKIQLECLLLDSVEFIYDYTADADEELIAPMPYDELYVYYICSRIDESLGEEKAYNDSITRYNNAQYKYQKWLIRTVDPANNKVQLKRSAPVIYRGEKATITLYGLPVGADEITAARATLTQGKTQQRITDTEVVDKSLTFSLTEQQTYALEEGSLFVGYSIVAGGYIYKDERVKRFCVMKSPNLGGDGSILPGVLVDESLTIPGRAADANVTGDKLRNLDAGVETLIMRTDRQETKIADVQAEIAEVRQNVVESNSSLADEIDVERNRITNLAALPDGSTTGDAELQDIRVDYVGASYGNAGEAVRGQVNVAITALRYYNQHLEENERLRQMTGGHLYRIWGDYTHRATTYRVSGGEIIVSNDNLKGTDFIKCPKYLAFHFENDTAFAYVYFYKLSGGEYKLTWTPLDIKDSSNLKNRVTKAQAAEFKFVLEIPDDTYMQLVIQKDTVQIYGWDGVPFGMPVSGDMIIMTTSSDVVSLWEAGTGGVVVPGSAKMLICNGKTVVQSLHGIKSGDTTYIYEYANKEFSKFYVLPEGYDYFRARLYTGYGDDGTFDKSTKTGDVSEYISIVCDSYCAARPTARAETVIARAKAICDYEWTPAKNLHSSSADTTSKTRFFKAGVTYNGFPYGSVWTWPLFIGWHVSPHTFLNAVADDASILYDKALDEGAGGENAPYYALVCTSFAEMAAGWPYPQKTVGLTVDPNIRIVHSPTPPVGAPWHDLKGAGAHCILPERVEYFGDGTYAVCVYEAMKPMTMRAARYSNIASGDSLHPFQVETKKVTNYGGALYHIHAPETLFRFDSENDNYVETVPYADFTDKTLVGGSARPYRGDKSVYTSDMDSVIINIKNPAATKLYIDYATEGGDVSIAIDTNNATQIDVKPRLKGSNIYHVYTDVDSTKESFEYVEVTPVEWWIEGENKLHFNRNDFWYANCVMYKPKWFPSVSGSDVNIPCNADGDYSDWAETCPIIKTVNAVFYKGQYGAYIVPLKKRTT